MDGAHVHGNLVWLLLHSDEGKIEREHFSPTGTCRHGFLMSTEHLDRLQMFTILYCM